MGRVISTGRALALGLGLAAVAAGGLRAQEPRPEGRIDLDEVISSTRATRVFGAAPGGESHFRNFNEVVQGAEKIDGLFTLHKKGDHLYAEIRNDQYNHPMLVPVTIARGMAQAGMPVGDDDMVLIFKRAGDKVQLIRRNIHYKASSNSLDKSVKQNYVDSILQSLPIIAINQGAGGAALIDLSDIFLNDFAQLGIGGVDRSRSGWHRVKGFPNNLELEVELTFSGGRFGRFYAGDDGVADRRGITLVVHYSLMRAPDMGYHPRTADDRVGHFLSASKDFGKTDPDTNFVRQINRWRLEKADPKAELSPPKKQIVWYIEDTVPIEYRPYVESGIREWNKAFEKIGYVDAIAVRWQEAGRDEFDPEDTNYCTFRWVTTDHGFAMSCLRANPLTGEMIDGDVVFDSGFIRSWKQQYALLIGTAESANGERRPTPLAVGEIISPILAEKMGFGRPANDALFGRPVDAGMTGRPAVEAIPDSMGAIQWQLAQNRSDSARAACLYNTGMTRDFALASMLFADPDDLPGPVRPIDPASAPAKIETKKDDKDKDAKKDDKPKKKASDELPREFVGQAIKHIVMHEVGHSLGLRHNFKASTMLPNDQLNDTAITRAKGLVGSVMDYSPINIAPPGTKQGDFYSTTIGPYDYWAIEYAYKQVDGSEDEELKKIAARAPEAGLAYATDEDVWSNGDPQVNRWDLGSDPCQFAKDRIHLAEKLMKELDAKVVKDGEPWARTRRAFHILLGQWGDAAVLASQYVGGQSVSRHHKGDKGASDPIVPVSGAKQRECLKFLVDEILSDKSFQFSPALLRRLGTEKWYHWGSNSFGGDADISVLETVLATQKIVLGECLNAGTLNRLQNQQLQSEPGSDPLRVEEVFRSLTDGIWSDLGSVAAKDAKDAKAGKVALTTMRRNLQREYLRRLSTMVLGSRSGGLGDSFSYLIILGGSNSSVPADARALARLHLGEIGDRIDKALADKGGAMDDTTRAHLKECRQRITKVLEANSETLQP